MALRVFTVPVALNASASADLDVTATALTDADDALDTLVDAALAVPAIDADTDSETAVEAIRTEYVAQFAAIAAARPSGAAQLVLNTSLVTTQAQALRAVEQLRNAILRSNEFPLT